MHPDYHNIFRCCALQIAMVKSAAHARIYKDPIVNKHVAMLVRLVTSVPHDVTLLHSLAAAALLPVLNW